MVFSSPQEIAEKGEKIYKEKCQADFEKKYAGRFVAIDIETRKYFLAKTAEGAIEAAQKDRDGGLFHLIKIGSAGAFHVSSYRI